ncbi:flavoprotein [Streptomyces sp. NPDC051018]|uniref:flavoprotein n=1 Tax=Streptomyces sp. NPDC051018 TaxID=3365639 RepID=UPI0037A56C13
MDEPEPRPFLYIVVCAASVAAGVGDLITAARRRGWDTAVVATPQGLGFLDVPAVEAHTGHPIRSAWRRPDEPRPLTPPDAIAVAPATFNTVNKWAAGIADTLALGILCEAHGNGVPTAVLPCANAAMAAHPAYRESVRRLRGMGVLFGAYESHDPDEHGRLARFRWEEALELLEPHRKRRDPLP